MRLPNWIALPCLAFVLAACQDSGERADEFYRSGIELRDSGDLERAALEFRNVFRFDGAHKPARTALAEVLMAQGSPNAALSQYLRLAEQYPDDAQIRIDISRIAIVQQAWGDLSRHGPVAVELAADRPESQAIAAFLDYIAATEAGSSEGQATAVEQAVALVDADPENTIARRLAIIGHVSAGDFDAALAALNDALDRAPDDLSFNRLKLQLLNELDRVDEAEALLIDMYDRFPENEDIARSLVIWYVQRDNLGAVETLLRDRAGPLDGPVADHVALIQFKVRTEGIDAARAELGPLLEANADDAAKIDTYTRVDAGLAFEAGDRDAAIAMLQARLDDGTDTDENAAIQTMLARMLATTDNQVGARALVEQVLADDPSNVEALKMQADWLIDADKTTEAIGALRTALDQSPDDADILTLMARAHERAGSTQLAGERLALAVDTSGSAPAEALRYAQFLLREDRMTAARAVLREAVDKNPSNVDLLTEQARLALTEEDTATARFAVRRLEAIEGNQIAADRAKALRAAILLGEQRFDEGVALLEERAEGDAPGAVVLDVVRTRLRAGQVDEARAYLRARLEDRPDDANLRFADAVLRMAAGEIDSAETGLRDLIADFPEAEAPARQLYGLLSAEDRDAEATEVLDAAIDRMPQSQTLLLLRASQLESADDFEGALKVYEQIYALDSDNLIAANNYASLLSDLRDDDASLARAAAVAQRLGDSDVAAFRDTYGWIAYRRGNYEEALEYLEPAAAELSENPVVLYHLGMTYAQLGRTEDARRTLEQAIELGGDRASPQLNRAREALQGL